jgi:AbrB family looped-hinge helix DNA binding protein
MPQTTLSSRGQVVFPSEFRDEDGLKPGEIFEVERTRAGEYIFRRKKRGSAGLLNALLEFQKIAPGEKLQLMDWSQETTDNFRKPFV